MLGRATPGVLCASVLALVLGCGSLPRTRRSACEPAQADTTEWRRDTVEAATLLIPPEFVRRPRLEVGLHGPPGPGFVDWVVPQAGTPIPDRIIAYDWDVPVPLPGGYRAGSERLQDRRECQWTVQGRTARVVTGWLPTDQGTTDRTYHTVAAWSDVQPGVHLMVFARAETAAEQERLFAVLQSLRFR